MKLEVGMYCYNKTNRKLGIGKIIDFQCNNNVNIRYKNDIELVSIGNVIANFNIIDILEEGDYVNGHPIYEIVEYEDDTRAIVIGDDNKSIIWKKKDIEDVITKEQFEQMKYRIGE